MRSLLTRDHGDHKHDWDDELTPDGVPVSLAEMSGSEVAHLIEDIDGYLCELGMAQIRDGLHILGEMPALPDTMRALTRLPNGAVPSVQAALAAMFGFEIDRCSRRRARASADVEQMPVLAIADGGCDVDIAGTPCITQRRCAGAVGASRARSVHRARR